METRLEMQGIKIPVDRKGKCASNGCNSLIFLTYGDAKGQALLRLPEFIREYIDCRDFYFGVIPSNEDGSGVEENTRTELSKERIRRDGTFITMGDFGAATELEVKIFHIDDSRKVSIECSGLAPIYPVGRTAPDRGPDMIIHLSGEILNAIKDQWKDSELAHVSFGVGRDANKQMYLFIQQADEEFFTSEGNSPVKIPL